jgi:hypothetical protein
MSEFGGESTGRFHRQACRVRSTPPWSTPHSGRVPPENYVHPYPPPHVQPYKIGFIPRTVVFSQNGNTVYQEDGEDLLPTVLHDDLGRPIPNPEYAKTMRPVAVFRTIDAFDGRFKGQISGSQIVERISTLFRAHGISTVVGDQRESFFLGSEFSRHDLQFREITWTNQSKIEAVTRLKRLFAEGAIVLPDRPKLRKELASYSERITASGSLTYSARGTGHDDEVSLLLTFAMAELERLVPGSPIHFGAGRHEASGR